MNLLNSQNAGLRPAMLALAVSVLRGSYIDFFEKFALSRFHGRGAANADCQVIALATSYGENQILLCNKTFCQKIPDFSPYSGFFRNFFTCPWSLDHF